MTDNTRYLPAIGRILIGGIFAMSGLTKISAYAATTGMIQAAGLPFASWAQRSRLLSNLALGRCFWSAGGHVRSLPRWFSGAW